MRQSKNFRSWLYQLTLHSPNLGLGRMRELLNRIGNPQKRFCAIHIGGTNGKGSTSAFAANLLLVANRFALGNGGLSAARVGLYTSPHLLRLTERIRYSDEFATNLVECTEDELEEAVTLIRQQSSDLAPTFFEVTTAAAFWIFAKKGVLCAVVEVGLGGRLDATNLCNPIATVITSIARDHTQILGETLAEIAFEKAGIFKPGIPAYVSCKDPHALLVLRRQAEAVGCPIFIYPEEETTKKDAVTEKDGTEEGGSIKSIVSIVPPLPSELKSSVSLRGAYQYRNAALAIAAVKHAPPTYLQWLSSIEIQKEGLSKTLWPGRLEKVARLGQGTEVWIDAAHNEEGALELAKWLDTFPYRKPLTILFGVVAEKEVSRMTAPLAYADRVILCRPLSRRAQDPYQFYPLIREQLYESIPVEVITNFDQALGKAIEQTPKSGTILVYGSLFLIGHVRRVLLNEPADPEILQEAGSPAQDA